ncbi:MAG: hypothetical protein KDD47_01910 [Acidobacteria bacterium]|nr:hypothetical protein [Acidobacteriota bacterium]
MAPLSTDLHHPESRPYFLWDEQTTIAELRQRLKGDDVHERLRLMAKMLREARDLDVWEFVRPQEVAEELPRIAHRLGRRRPFWEFLIGGWREDGLL